MAHRLEKTVLSIVASSDRISCRIQDPLLQLLLVFSAGIGDNHDAVKLADTLEFRNGESSPC